MKPMFAKDKSSYRSLMFDAEAGATALPVLDADEYYSVGDWLFCSEDGETDIECLGPVVDASVEAVTATFPLATAKPAGSKVWTPLHLLRWSCGRSAPIQRVYDSGVVVQRVVGGALYHTRLREPFREETLVFERAPRSDYEAYFTWFRDVTDGGVEPFWLVDEERVVATVKFLDSTVEQHESPAGVARIVARLGWV